MTDKGLHPAALRGLTLRFRRRQWPKRGTSGGYWRSLASDCSARSPRHLSLTSVYPARLLEHLVRQHQEVRGHRDPEGLGSLEVDDQLELHRLLYGQVGRFGPFQDFIHIRGGTPEQVGPVWPIRHQTTSVHEFPEVKYRR